MATYRLTKLGTSGILSPFAKIKGLYFDSNGEPDEFMKEFTNDINRLISESPNGGIIIEFEDNESYYEILNYIDKYLDENIKVFGVDRNKPTVIFEREEDMIAEHEQVQGSEIYDKLEEDDDDSTD